MTTKTKTAAKKAAPSKKTATAKKAIAAKTPAAKPAAPAAKPAAPAPAPAKKAPRVSMWGAAREFIKAGKSNAAVLEMLRAQFGLPEAHNYYPVWYRAHAVKNGVVTRAFAAEHAGPPIARKPAAAKP